MSKKILVVEDDSFLRKIIVKKLIKEGYKVVEAINGEEGIRMAKKEKPDLILLDLILPGVDGFEALEAIKKNSKTSKIPVIILSNLSDSNEIRRALKLGATDYLIKAHLDPGKIIIRIEVVLKKNKK